MPQLPVFKFVPDENGQWSVMDQGNMALFPDRPGSPTREVAIDNIRDWAKERGLGVSVTYSPEGVPISAEVVHPVVRLDLKISEGLDDVMDEMASRLKVPKGDVIRKAISLLKIAMDAKREGKRVAIIDDRDESEQDLVGF